MRGRGHQSQQITESEQKDEVPPQIGLPLTIQEVAERLGISVEAAQALVRAGLNGIQQAEA
jgi:hypothetical protein